ncbi:MAG: hypothetical protein UY87_C0068G0006 [Candidatus Peribacteria bacterium GW2011_GWC2_54_8]|nr:MAG: hypothetical protein UY87_C0068G0006 [Candidatus Peribacteria bacterium GW2011_GWC2_54_8]KKW43345.1 MAG: hypothetical protein UY90_C0028G0009 [Candidatus Peregrinibacteria bacterium GW2011_GWA2_54_9]
MLAGCNAVDLSCIEGFEKNERSEGVIFFLCENPEFEITCDVKTYVYVDGRHSCISFNGDKYLILETEDVTNQPEEQMSSVSSAEEEREVRVQATPIVQPEKAVESASEIEKIGEIVCKDGDWNCESWGSCTAGTQSRECVLSSDCIVKDFSPEIVRTCTVTRVCGGSDWDCSGWTHCINGKRTRVCDLQSKDCRIVSPVSTEEACSNLESRLLEMSTDIDAREVWLNKWDGVAKELASNSANEIYSITNKYRKDLMEYMGIYNDLVSGKATVALVGYRISNLMLEMDSLQESIKKITLVYPAK